VEEGLLNTENAITPVPVRDTSAKMVLSYSTNPHMVTKMSNGQNKILPA